MKNKIIIIIISFFPIALYSQKVTFTTINKKEIFELGAMGSKQESQFAEYIPYQAFNLETIKEIKFKILAQNTSSQFYINIFKNNNGKPGDILYHIPIKSKKNYKTQSVNIDFTAQQIIIPENGIFIGIEWVINRKNKQIPDKVFISNANPPYYPKIKLNTSIKNNLWCLKNNVWEITENNFGDYNSLDLEIN